MLLQHGHVHVLQMSSSSSSSPPASASHHRHLIMFVGTYCNSHELELHAKLCLSVFFLSAEIEKFILFASPRSVRTIPLEESNGYSVDAAPPIVGQQRSRLGVNYVAIDYDAQNKTVFFSDVRNRVIYTSKIGESGECWCDMPLGALSLSCWCNHYPNIVKQSCPHP